MNSKQAHAAYIKRFGNPPEPEKFVRQSRRPLTVVNPVSGKAQEFEVKAADFPALGAPESWPSKTKATSASKISNHGAAIKDVLPSTATASTREHAPKISPAESSSKSRSRPASKIPTHVSVVQDALPTSNTHSPDNDEVEAGFNVYARPFVPESLTIISSLEGHVMETPPGRRMDFEAYVRSYLGLHFLPPVPTLENRPGSASTTSGTFPDADYGHVLRRYIEEEVEAQRAENDWCTLYGHDVTLNEPKPGDTEDLATCSFIVPGLRENKPNIEEGDSIELRQLRYDPRNQPCNMNRWLAGPIFKARSHEILSVGGRWTGEPAPGWTGIIYNARVAAVQRAQEKLTIKIARSVSLAYAVPARTNNLKFNISFPIQIDRYLPMTNVLPLIQRSLDYVADTALVEASPKYVADDDTLAETSLRRQHWVKSMLAPVKENNELQMTLNPAFVNRPFFDNNLNWEQKKAVESISRQNYGTLPFLISGPPGTGKTKTLVETALQLVRNVNGVNSILIVAPSDPAADTLVQRLSHHLGQSELLRLNRLARTFNEVPDSVLRFCYIAQDTFCLPPMHQLMSYKVVVTTCRDAALLVYSRMTNADLYAAETGLLSALHPEYSIPAKVKLHWTALLMDETAQALETEALIPLSVVAPPCEPIEFDFKPLVVMAGDEYQLGPRVSLRTSPLKISLFARLFARPVYANHPLARGESGQAPPTLNSRMLPIFRPAFTNLIRNYRSHPAILAVPSALFYKDTLEAEAADTNRFSSWSGWKKAGWPVLFHNNASKDDLEADGGGWYNKGEAIIACKYAASLVKTGLVAQKDICIMSPFKSQVACLRKTIREPQFGSLWEVDIGPLEAFQGLERDVVILCTTRSRQKFVEKDKELDWGIINQPTKMNVALTRAKYGLIVIGKMEILREDANWEYWLRFCMRNGLVAGDKWAVGVVGELTRMEKVLISRERDEQVEVEETRKLDVYPQEDEMWTRGMADALDVAAIDEALDLEYGAVDREGDFGEEEEDGDGGEDEGDD